MRKLLILIASAGLTAGCTPIDVGLGDAHRHNVALQTLDPDPRYEGVVLEGGSGDLAAAASKRYREGKVIPPVTIKTSTTTGGGGGGGSN